MKDIKFVNINGALYSYEEAKAKSGRIYPKYLSCPLQGLYSFLKENITEDCEIIIHDTNWFRIKFPRKEEYKYYKVLERTLGHIEINDILYKEDFTVEGVSFVNKYLTGVDYEIKGAAEQILRTYQSKNSRTYTGTPIFINVDIKDSIGYQIGGISYMLLELGNTKKVAISLINITLFTNAIPYIRYTMKGITEY